MNMPRIIIPGVHYGIVLIEPGQTRLVTIMDLFMRPSDVGMYTSRSHYYGLYMKPGFQQGDKYKEEEAILKWVDDKTWQLIPWTVCVTSNPIIWNQYDPQAGWNDWVEVFSNLVDKHTGDAYIYSMKFVV